jgi:spermidine synthase
MRVIRTRNGLRLSQHGIVISELRTTPGPTHSVFDVLAAAIRVLRPDGRIGLLGFAGGGMMAPLDALGATTPLHAVDLDRAAFELFRHHCPHWKNRVQWQHSDAVAWLRQQPARFDLLMEDLSIPHAGDVIKPDVSWTVLPRLIRQHLRPDGIAVFNLLPPPHASFTAATARVAGEFNTARLVHLEEFENRILIAGCELPTARELGLQFRRALRSLRSKQAERIRVQSL